MGLFSHEILFQSLQYILHYIFRTLAKAKARHTGDLEEVICRRSWQKLGLLVQKGNCALFNNRVPDVDKQDDK